MIAFKTYSQLTPSKNGSESIVSIAQKPIGRRIQFKPADAINAKSSSVMKLNRESKKKGVIKMSVSVEREYQLEEDSYHSRIVMLSHSSLKQLLTSLRDVLTRKFVLVNDRVRGVLVRLV